MTAPDLVEFAAIPDVFASGLGRAEDVGGGCIRLTFFANDNGQRVVAAKVVMPAEAVADLVKAIHNGRRQTIDEAGEVASVN
ncbi:hypothetical protein [Microbaculum marinisediminis]|uniref:Uncharacterized protein n=1 Tax=Microbaculum marinisediminis TaxID=2931392 RepID=A0AAW5QUH5_9HYPH|nr:hypothetical protein [Microbaculum sp. A6E488]MCT8970882.1 hypothetical protein [Microbaculum sp. A6E488]